MSTNKTTTPKKPKGYENDLADYDAVSYDSWNGTPVAWGFKIIKRLGDERFGKLSDYGSVEVVGREYGTTWALIVRRLKLSEAIKLFGPVTKVVTGPRGGARHVEFTKEDITLENPIRINTNNMEWDVEVPEKLTKIED